MQTALEHYNEIDADDLLLLRQIRAWIDGLPDKGNPNDGGDHLWSCHALCRAASTIFSLGDRRWRVVDGYFARRANDHTWLIREEGAPTTRDYRGTILDIYPVASAGAPILFCVSGWTSPWSDLYFPEERRYNESRVAEFGKEAAALVQIDAQLQSSTNEGSRLNALADVCFGGRR